jgi:hypothetical protein
MITTFLLLTLLVSPPQINPTSATLQGLVRSATTDSPVEDAGVELVSVAQGVSARFVVATEADGTFTFKNVPPGDYRVAATHSGFVRSAYGQRAPGGTGQTITIKAGDVVKGIRVSLVETGAISGRVLDRNRVPMANVQLQAMRFTNMGGLPFVETVATAITNDLGEYRLFWLPPDEYIVMAMPIRGSVDDELVKTDGANTVTNFVRPAAGTLIVGPTDIPPMPFFFRDSNDPGTATRAILKPGENLRGIDIEIRPPATYSIKGKITNIPGAPSGPTGRPPGPMDRGIEIRLEPRKAPEIRYRDSMPNGLLSLDSKSGTFEIRGVLPGSYWVFAQAFGNQAKASVDVVGKDVEDVAISFLAGFDVPLKITVEGTTDVSRINRVIDSLEVYLTADVRSGDGIAAEEVQGQSPGTLIAHNVVAGSYHVGWSMIGLPGGYFKSTRIDGAEVREAFRLDRPPIRPIEVVFGIGTGVITGTVTNNKLQPASDVTVVAWGSKGSFHTTTSPDGSFRIAEVPPGDYRVFAWEAIKLYSWQDPEVMRRDGPKGIPVHLDEGSNVTVNPTSIRAPGK